MTELIKLYEKETGDLRPIGCCETYLLGWYERFSQWLCKQFIWKPVSEIPRENVNVEVCDLSKTSLDEREPVIAYYEQGEWICVFPYNFNVYAYVTPTHWRYIQPAPEGEIK